MTLTPGKPDIMDWSHAMLIGWLEDRGVRPFRADQIFNWIYLRQADSFDAMTDLRKDLRSVLAENFVLGRLEAVKSAESGDGTRKFLFRLSDGEEIESVLIPERDHFTLCVSTQVGCAMGCRFCLTGSGGLVRNLSPGEILAQVRDVQQLAGRSMRLTNIVFMGMGEPLANYRNLKQALEILTASKCGMQFAGRRVTVSTAGLAPRIIDLGNDTRVNLAVSLNAVDDEIRSRLMPVNRKYPISVLLDACRRFNLPRGRRITFEYILIDGINDSPRHARQLADLLAPLRAKINLIPFNEHPASDFRRPDQAAIDAFHELLIKRRFTCIVRYSKGRDILAACGQLRAGQARSK